MMSRRLALEAIVVGDLIYAINDVGRACLLLVYDTGGGACFARNVLNQMTYEFDREGKAYWGADGDVCTVVSTAPLPPEQYQVAIALDRRMGSRPEYPDTRLTEDEIQLILTHSGHFESRLLPGTETLVRRAQKCRAVGSLLTLEWDPFHADPNPASVFEYDDYLPAMVDLLDKPAPENDVADFLAKIAALRNRPSRVLEGAAAAAASLMRLQQSWLGDAL